MSAVLDKNGKPMRLVAATNTTPVKDAKPKPLAVCACENHVIPIAQYMVTEMQRNPFSAEGKKMTEANAYDVEQEGKAWDALPWYHKIGGRPNFVSISLGKRSAAYTIWANQVRPGAPWDHKPILSGRLKEKNILNKGYQRYGNEDYFYDIWSNIHYGYVGAACGFGLDELLGGAGIAQALSDTVGNAFRGKRPKIQNHPENGAWANQFDDIPDNISIKLGVTLYKQIKPAALTVDVLLKAIASVPIPWGAGKYVAKRPHECIK